MHIKNGQCNLGSPVNNFFFLQLPTPKVFLLLNNKLVKITTMTKLHNDIEVLPILYTFPIGYNIDMFKLLKQFNLIVDIFNLLTSLVG